ncbi:MAG: hypothetical protein ACLFQV_02935 [Vulcanimicrobiota bacterium]
MGREWADKKNIPSKKDLEKDLAKLRDSSASIEKITKSMADGNSKAGISSIFENHLSSQKDIVDKFINLCQDREALIKFTKIVQNIQIKVELLKHLENPGQYEALKQQIMEHLDEWAKCLETIIQGVMKQTRD